MSMVPIVAELSFCPEPRREILIVEDEGIVALDLRHNLEKSGYSVTGVAASGEQALDILERHRPNLVLMDIELAGGLSGTETAKIVQERFKIPVVYLTAYTDATTLQAIGETGEHGFLAKPIRNQDLLPVVKLAIARYEAQQRQGEQDRKAWEDLCRRSKEQLEQFTYAASHDLKEPLRTARSFMDLFVKRSSGKLDEQDRQLLSQATDGLRRMNILLEDLLQFAQAGLSTGAPIPETPADAALSSALLHLQGAIADSAAQITYDQLPIVRADPSQLAQVFQNLLSNAMKYRRIEDKPKIHVSAGIQNDRYHFSVRDNGIGFEPKDASRIFEPFKRLHSWSAIPGNGIGLAICKKIVEAHGGEIWAESAPGQGSEFFFTLRKG
jgi:two-component system sensor histidine kinase/response regulator